MSAKSWIRALWHGRDGTAEEEERDRPSGKRSTQRDREIRELGKVNGKHFTKYVDAVKDLKRKNHTEEAIELLFQLVDASERESVASTHHYSATPWLYEQLAILFRKEKRYGDEVAILERYAALFKPPKQLPKKLEQRLDKARNLWSRELYG